MFEAGAGTRSESGEILPGIDANIFWGAKLVITLTEVRSLPPLTILSDNCKDTDKRYLMNTPTDTKERVRWGSVST